MQLFLSHISEEASIAKVLKDWIETTFLGNISVFVSSDISDIPAGKKWLEEIEKALSSSNALFALCSPNSIYRPWVNFEAGCAWILKKPIYPICHSGLKKGDLPQPISIFQALDLEDDQFITDLFSSLAKEFGFLKIPKIAIEDMKRELSDAQKGIISATCPIPSPTVPTTGKEDLDKTQNMILLFFSTHDGQEIKAEHIEASFSISRTKAEYHLDILVKKKLIYAHLNYVYGTSYTLTAKGRAYLVENRIV